MITLLCINPGEYHLTIGKIYTAEREDKAYYYGIKDNDGREVSAYKTRFKTSKDCKSCISRNCNSCSLDNKGS